MTLLQSPCRNARMTRRWVKLETHIGTRTAIGLMELVVGDIFQAITSILRVNGASTWGEYPAYIQPTPTVSAIPTIDNPILALLTLHLLIPNYGCIDASSQFFAQTYPDSLISLSGSSSDEVHLLSSNSDSSDKNVKIPDALFAVDQLWPQLQRLVEPYGLRRRAKESIEQVDVGKVRQEADDLREPERTWDWC